ncbi:fungal-specific transcription factor domain-containing protein [Glomus cerebriforme]|uniref:Fungal-specific transcription factor domain-containing protein n=1 Tax=Glomus cerebriforme TaxID=658196 RepID=A0A397SNV0_9GLOM|nr:fungal-specific transcription factor domain-containing protein [Glomus cerebriforme]RIA89889.1 fungal-specific transcription factor domain-containing protein [Glomus cerebriforme]
MSLFILDDMIVDESGGDSHENKRVKITTACDTCRRRKVKCDGESPCANCQRGSYQCTFSDASAKRPRGPPKGFVALIEDRLHTIESLLVNLVNKDNVPDISTITKDIKHFSDMSHNQPGYADEITNEDNEILLNNLIYPNESNTLQSNTLSFLGQNSNNGLSDYIEPSLPNLPVNLKPIPEEISRPLFEKYFKHVHPYFPIINRGHFFRLLNNADVKDQPSKLLIEAIFAIGAMFPPTVKQNSEYSSQFFYERAKSILDYFIDVPRLSTIQALILLFMIDQGKPSSYRSQTFCSIAIKMAQTIGLNRKNGAAYQGAKDRQTKKLVWWGCFILDRLNSLGTGDSLVINDKMCDIELPSSDEMDHDDINFQNNEDSSSSTFSHSFTYKQQINSFINYIRILKITGQVLEHLQTISCSGLQSSWNHHAIIDIFESLLSDWLRDLPPYLNYVPSSQNLPLLGQIANLHMIHQTLYLLLHYPYIAEYDKLRRGDRNFRTSKTFVKSMNICNSAANTITNIGVEALSNVYTCSTFPAMLYCLCKAAKVHSINITSSQRGLAISSYKNIIKTVKICQFYRQNNIMKELVQKTTILLENILIQHQDKFSHEEIFGITPSGEIVNPDGLDITLSCLSTNGIGNSLSNPSPMSHMKITSNQVYSPVDNTNNNNSKSINSIQSILPQKRNDTQSNSFLQGENDVNISPTESLFTNSFAQIQSITQNVITTTSSNGQLWEMINEGFNDNSSYDHMSSTPTTSANQSTNYFSPPQPQRTQSLPNSNSSQMDQYNSNTFKSNSLSSHSRTNLSLDPIGQEIYNSPSSSPISPTLQQSQSISTTPNETTYRIFNNVPTTTTSPTSSRSRSRTTSPFSSSSSSSEKEKEINVIYLDNSNDDNLLGKIRNCGVTSPSNVDNYETENDYNQFESNNMAINMDIGGFRSFEYGLCGNI